MRISLAGPGEVAFQHFALLIDRSPQVMHLAIDVGFAALRNSSGAFGLTGPASAFSTLANFSYPPIRLLFLRRNSGCQDFLKSHGPPIGYYGVDIERVGNVLARVSPH